MNLIPPDACPTPAAADARAMVSLYEKQAKIYPRSVSGLFARWRWTMVVLTQAVFYGTPWLPWHGRQAVLFDLAAQRFYIFGLVLHPQDLIWLAALLVISALALFFFTAVAGRLWCGYACPQTVYTEIFLWIERHTEGDRTARIKLDAAPWDASKLLRKGSKHVAWLVWALATGFTFVGYFTPIRELAAQLAALALGPWEMFWVLFYGAATYGNAGWMREQICKYMCPYARFQSALIDGDSLVIAYDGQRGESRGPRSRKADARALGLGDCVDCSLCVQVCPTGIDIRNGLQNECIGCAACIDVCNGVMDRMNYPKGLIRYATGNGIAQGLSRARMLQRALRPRVLVYGLLLLAVSAAFAGSIWLRSGLAVDVIRDRGTLARVVEDGRIENVYRLQLMNRLEHPQRVHISVAGIDALRLATDGHAEIEPNQIRSLTARLELPHEAARGMASGAHKIEFLLTPEAGDGNAPRPIRETSTFVIPR
jgi:cytochrome c oxidase accessory protein FixG